MGGVGRAASLCTSTERHLVDPPAQEKEALDSLGKVISGATPQELVKISMDVIKEVMRNFRPSISREIIASYEQDHKKFSGSEPEPPGRSPIGFNRN